MEGTEEFNGLDYNTARETLAMPEFGRNVLKMVEHLKEITDKDKRTEQAKAVVKVMEILNPQVHQQENFDHKLWDQLYIMAGYDIDIDAPYPAPQKEDFEKKPVAIPMKGSKIKATHYGRNIEKIIELLIGEPDGEAKTEMIRCLAIYMRQQYLIWNKDSVADETIFNDIEKLADGKLQVPRDIDLGKIAAEASFSRPTMGINVGQSGKSFQGRRNGRNNKKKK